ncbi:MAG: UDP-3-O-(3-hydroxymyristoyl)glucosamine N-acyltransferase [Bacteroidales bacterium]|nr:UDP-3-O-(3-hydroxymyristoyl)glucosamine N-acyltransferase [Bacteroidales bacterium]MBN2817718.1 UDP-3-O-(3-hydroxymyristoyl)glucosamine N-acyltransferase [Bacteroidales bacterium]
MEFTAKTIAEFLKGTVIGNPDEKVSDVAPIENGKPGTLAFLANPKYAKHIYTTNASIVLIGKDFKPDKEIKSTLVQVEDAYKAFASLLDLYQSMIPKKTGIDSRASISSTASVGENCYIGDFAYIGENSKIGSNVQIYPQVYIGDNVIVDDNTILYPGVKIYLNCKLGKNCIIHSGTVIGSDGFGFAPADGSYKKIPQIGNVVIEDDVEIGSNCSIDRATMGSTTIKKGVKLDNLVQIAHNVEIGESTVMAAQVGIAGSTKIGANCLFGGQVGVAGHLSICNEVKVGAQAGIGKNVKIDGTALWGSPAFEYSKVTRSIAAYKALPDLVTRINQLEREIKDLKNEK